MNEDHLPVKLAYGQVSANDLHMFLFISSIKTNDRMSYISLKDYYNLQHC